MFVTALRGCWNMGAGRCSGIISEGALGAKRALAFKSGFSRPAGDLGDLGCCLDGSTMGKMNGDEWFMMMEWKWREGDGGSTS